MLKFYHAPWSRSSVIFWLLEELGATYEMTLVDIRSEKGAPEEYRKIQPNKKVPAVDHDGIIITERAAIATYLGDVFPGKGLAPAIGDSDRAAYLSSLVYHDAVFDPVVCAKLHGLEYLSNNYPFGLFDDMVGYLERKFSTQRWAAGDRFTIADVMLGGGMNFTMNTLKVLPERPIFNDYVSRCTDRPAFVQSAKRDMELAKQLPYFQSIFRNSALHQANEK